MFGQNTQLLLRTPGSYRVGNGVDGVFSCSIFKSRVWARELLNPRSCDVPCCLWQIDELQHCRSFPEAGAGRLLLSGGNDGKVQLQSWTQNLPAGSVFRETSDGHGGSEFCIEHGQKVNCVAAPGSMDKIFVAGVSNFVSVYAVG